MSLYHYFHATKPDGEPVQIRLPKALAKQVLSHMGPYDRLEVSEDLTLMKVKSPPSQPLSLAPSQYDTEVPK